MGNALLMKLEEVLERERLEDSPTAPAFRKIFRSWNSTDLWTGLRRYFGTDLWTGLRRYLPQIYGPD